MEPRTLTYRKPWLFRAVFVLVSLLAIADFIGMWSDIASRPHPDYSALPIAVLLFGGASLIFFCLSGPNDLYLNMEQKTYRHVKGLPFSPKTRTGPVSDFWGIYMGRTRSNSNYCVGVIWWGGGDVILRSGLDRLEAERFAAILRAMLELKEVMPPRNLRPS